MGKNWIVAGVIAGIIYIAALAYYVRRLITHPEEV